MNSNEIATNITTVLKALDTIEVRGKQNVTNLAGSIGTLEYILIQLSEKQEQPDPKEE